MLWSTLGPTEILVEEQAAGYAGFAGSLGLTTLRLLFVSVRSTGEAPFWISIPLREIRVVRVLGRWAPLRGCRLGVRFRQTTGDRYLPLMTHGGSMERGKELSEAAARLIEDSQTVPTWNGGGADVDASADVISLIEERGGAAWVDMNHVGELHLGYSPETDVQFYRYEPFRDTKLYLADELRWFSGITLARSRLRRSGVRVALSPAELPDLTACSQ